MSARLPVVLAVLAGLLVSACGGAIQYREGRGCASRDDNRCRIGAN